MSKSASLSDQLVQPPANKAQAPGSATSAERDLASQPGITIIGVDHYYQLDDEVMLGELEIWQKACYVELLREVQSRTGATVIGEEICLDDTDSFARKLADENRITYVDVDMSLNERLEHGIPTGYCDLDSPLTPQQIDEMHGLRERFMMERLLEARRGDDHAVLICHRFHAHRIAPMLRCRGLACTVIDIADLPWYVDDWLSHY